VGKCNDLLKISRSVGLGVLDRIGTMDELSVSLHMSETKQQSEQCTKKAQRCPAYTKVHVSKKKKLALAFFDSQGII
jgi:hypothetical protein